MRFSLALAALVALTACGGPDRITRNAAVDAPAVPAPQLAFAVADVAVLVPIGLEVSEAPGYYPHADIVWRGVPMGDRLAQVRAIFEQAATEAGATDGQPARVEIEVVRFHGLTQRARYATGGVYAIQFQLTLTDPETGIALAEPRLVRADLNKFGAWHATFNDAKGITEKAMIVGHLRAVLRAELGQPSGSQVAQTE